MKVALEAVVNANGEAIQSIVVTKIDLMKLPVAIAEAISVQYGSIKDRPDELNQRIARRNERSTRSDESSRRRAAG